jgi:hypothetical protein
VWNSSRHGTSRGVRAVTVAVQQVDVQVDLSTYRQLHADTEVTISVGRHSKTFFFSSDVGLFIVDATFHCSTWLLER